MADFEFRIKLTDKELEKLGVFPDDKQACEEKIMSVLRGESLAFKDLDFRESVVSDIELPQASEDCFKAVVFSEDEIYVNCLNRAGVDTGNHSAAYIASVSELRLSINKEIEYGGIALGMEYDGKYYNVPLSNEEASALHDMTNREVLSRYGTSISQYFEDLSSKEIKRDNTKINDYLSH